MERYEYGEKTMDQTLERTTMRKVYLRMLPLAMIVYFFCYLDRINISFAALQMNASIGLTAAAYGLSSTAFYIGYCIFEVPSNVILEKVGARIWIARIMITWGIASGATAFVTGPTSFLVVRFLLGVAEAGLFPGIVLLFTYWFPDHHRARIVSSFTLALPISVAIGAPISTAILGLDGFLGYAGWKLIYILEAIPTVLMGCFVLFAMTDKPANARWLSAEQKNWLVTTLERERRAVEAGGKYSLWQALVNPKILLLSLNYLGIVTASLGVLLFVPQIIKALGATNMGTGFATMLAYICGAISMMTWGWISDRMGERRWNLFWACTLATCGLVLAGMTIGSWWSLVGLFFLVTASHGILDALTNGGLGVAFFSPFDSARYFFPWRPISVSPVGVGRFFSAQGVAILASEIQYAWLPLATFWAVAGVLRRRLDRKSTHFP